MKRNIIPLCFFAALFIVNAGCHGLNSIDAEAYRNLERLGVPLIEEKNPVLAGVLNILPGAGDVYLGQWGAFVCNLLLWPCSVVWGVPEAAMTAVNINKQNTVIHYRFQADLRWMRINGDRRWRNIDPMTFAPRDVTETR